jgi:hypothetical protein
MLVQVVKEERGNKGAALTTYLSLAGRYSVLMPNTPRGGGISRKIVNSADRKRLKSIVSELDIPEGQGLIVRTAGAKRTKAEIKRDYEYLMRLWEQVRDLTLRSIAPAPTAGTPAPQVPLQHAQEGRPVGIVAGGPVWMGCSTANSRVNVTIQEMPRARRVRCANRCVSA